MSDRSKIIEFDLHGQRVQARVRRTNARPDAGADGANRIHRLEFLSGNAEGRTGWVILDEQKMTLRPSSRKSEIIPFRFVGLRSNHWPGGGLNGSHPPYRGKEAAFMWGHEASGDGARFQPDQAGDGKNLGDLLPNLGGMRKIPLMKGMQRKDPKQCRIVYDAEVQPKLDILSWAYVSFYHCACYNSQRSYLHLRENSIESNLSVRTCCGCGGFKDITNVHYFDSGPYGKGLKQMWCGCIPCCCMVGQPKLTTAELGCFFFGMKCDPFLRDGKQLVYMPFEQCPLPLCCISNITGKGAFPGPFDNCFGWFGPYTGQPRIFSHVLPQPLIAAEFDAFAQQVMSGMIPPDDFVPVIEQHRMDVPRDGWEQKENDDGRIYYANATTGETSWDRPGSPEAMAKKAAGTANDGVSSVLGAADTALFGGDGWNPPPAAAKKPEEPTAGSTSGSGGGAGGDGGVPWA